MSEPAPRASSHDPNRRRELTPGGRVAAAWTEAPGLDAKRLADTLAQEIEGEVRFSAGDRALYATDASNYRQVPIGLVVPKTYRDVEVAVAACREAGAPILPRGGGTSLSGETCNTAVVLDFSKYLNRVIALDPAARTARVQAGCILDTLQGDAGAHDLIFGPDPATHGHNSFGGMIGNNSGGVHALMNGITVHNVRQLDILTYGGLRLEVGPTSEQALQGILRAGGRRAEIYRRLDELRRRYGDQIRARSPDIPRRVSGYENLNWLLPENGFDVAKALVGTEGTCATVLEATVDLIPRPRARVVVIVGFPDIFHAADAVPRVLGHRPIGLEGMDDLLVGFMRRKKLHVQDIEVLPDGAGWLVVEFGADRPDEVSEAGERLMHDFEGERGVETKIIRDPGQQTRIWNVRESGLGATAYVPNHPDTWPGWEDSAVHPDDLGAYLRELKALFQRYGYDPSVYGHFGDGLVHCRVSFDLYSEPGVAHWRRFLDEAADVVVRYNGSLSGEHGDGQARAALLERMYGPALIQCFREFKAIWDPNAKMNPGKVVDPYRIASNLRIGPRYDPPKLAHSFAYRNDHGSFARAVQRCVGVGKCRRPHSDEGVMCPSFMATREEKHSTRGRARLLFEMLHGDPIDSGWRSGEVEEALQPLPLLQGLQA